MDLRIRDWKWRMIFELVLGGDLSLFPPLINYLTTYTETKYIKKLIKRHSTVPNRCLLEVGGETEFHSDLNKLVIPVRPWCHAPMPNLPKSTSSRS